MENSIQDNSPYADGIAISYSGLNSQDRYLMSGNNSAFSTAPSSRNSFEMSAGGNQRQTIVSQGMMNQASSRPLSPDDAAPQYYGSNSGFQSGMSNSINTHDTDNNASSENSNMGNNGHNYLSNAPYSQDQYSVVNGQYGESNNFSGWNSGVTSRGSPQASMEHPQVNRLDRNSVGGFSQNQNQNHGMNMHSQQDWQGHSMQRGISSDAQMPFLQQQQHLINYNNNNDFNSLNGGENMMGMGIGMGMGMGMNHSMNRSNNRFASSQMSQMGQNQSGGRNFISSLSGTGGSNAQGRALNKMLLEILRDRMVDPNRLAMAIDANIERMDCVNLATLLFHTGKKRLLLTPSFIKRIAARLNLLKEELRAREASNALYGLKCMSSECVEVRQLIFALANKVAGSNTELVAQAVGNALYGCQMMTSDHEEVRYLLQVLSVKVNQCTELLEAQNVGNALYGLRGMGSDYKEVRALLSALTPKVATAREDLNGQALGNSLYGLQGMSSREQEVRTLLTVLAQKVIHTREALKAQEVGNALYGLKRMSSDVLEVRQLIDALVPKVANSAEILDAQAIGNSFYGMQNMHADNPAVLSLLATMADKVALSGAELDGQAMGNSLYGLQGMSSEHAEVRAVVNAITTKIQSSCLEMNAQELGNALYGLQDMTSDYPEVRRLMTALSQKVASSKYELTSQEIGNALFGLQGMRANVWETRVLVLQMAVKIQLSHSLIDPQGISNSLYGIQRMTSDCEDVRMLVQALAAKIELSWKLLSAQHLANCMFGLQGLSSAEVEVRALVHALVPKILACRDELSAKQISHAMYGLQNLSSEHEEVLPLVGALTEKLTLCSETISIRSLSALMYGLQGMENNSQEVKQLIAAVGVKLSAADEVDSSSLGNCLFSLQRMDNSSSEVCVLLSVIDSLLAAIVDSGLDLSPLVCANTLYGLQNCSIADESTRRIMYLVVSRIKEILVAQNAATVPRQGPLGRFSDLLGLYQALSLVVPMQPDLEIDTELQLELLTVQAAFAQMVAERSSEFKPVPLSATEARLVGGITDLLANEPFEVTHSVLLHGFTACVVVKLKEGIHLQTSSGEIWSPVLVIEPSGGANASFPRRQLFTRLKHEFFRHAHRIQVQTVPVTALIGEGKSVLKSRLLDLPDLLHALYPPTLEDSTNFSSILFSMGLTGPEGLLSSASLTASGTRSPHPLSRGDRDRERDGQGVGSSFFSGGGSNSSFTGGSEEPCDGSLECCLDFHETAPYTASQRSMLANSSMQQGMAIRWLGDPPVVVSTSPSPHPRATPLNRNPAVLPSSAGISVMPATNTNSSSKYAPTLTSTTGVPLTANQYPPPPLQRNNSGRSLHSQNQNQNNQNQNNQHQNQSNQNQGSKSLAPHHPPSGLAPHVYAGYNNHNNQNNASNGSRSSSRSGSATPTNNSPHGPSSRSNSGSISRVGSTDYYTAPDKRAISEHLHLQAVAAYNNAEQVNHRLAIQNHALSTSPRKIHSLIVESVVSEVTDVDDDASSPHRDKREQAAVDKEIEELEAELEIARLEAKLAKLRNAKKSSVSVSSNSSLGRSSNDNAETPVRQSSYESEASAKFDIHSSKSESESEKRARGDLPQDSNSDGIDI